jgi:4-diphosphocytidyl-2-C-methyl-D-erythritol kinase
VVSSVIAAGTRLAPAKLNLSLEILSRREDGMHTLRSVMVPIGLCDTIRWTPAGRFAFRCSERELEPGNLVVRAFELLGLGDAPLEITLEKAVPVGGGLGGGSSDGAAIVLAAAEGAFGPLEARDWVEVTRRLGSDVSFFLARTGALIEGTGERVTPLGALPPWWAVVYRPAAAVPTAHAYRLFDERAGAKASRPRGASASLAVADALQRADFDALGPLLSNDFHELVLAEYPAIARACEALRGAGARYPLLSGSGSALFELAPDEARARAIAGRLRPQPGEAVFTVPLHRDPAWNGA